MIKKFQEGFPDADVYQLEASGHFPQEEEPEKVVKAIQRFLKDENQVLNSPDRF